MRCEKYTLIFFIYLNFYFSSTQYIIVYQLLNYLKNMNLWINGVLDVTKVSNPTRNNRHVLPTRHPNKPKM
jgi:hypothetical protein